MFKANTEEFTQAAELSCSMMENAQMAAVRAAAVAAEFGEDGDGRWSVAGQNTQLNVVLALNDIKEGLIVFSNTVEEASEELQSWICPTRDRVLQVVGSGPSNANVVALTDSPTVSNACEFAEQAANDAEQAINNALEALKGLDDSASIAAHLNALKTEVTTERQKISDLGTEFSAYQSAVNGWEMQFQSAFEKEFLTEEILDKSFRQVDPDSDSPAAGIIGIIMSPYWKKLTSSDPQKAQEAWASLGLKLCKEWGKNEFKDFEKWSEEFFKKRGFLNPVQWGGVWQEIEDGRLDLYDLFKSMQKNGIDGDGMLKVLNAGGKVGSAAMRGLGYWEEIMSICDDAQKAYDAESGDFADKQAAALLTMLGDAGIDFVGDSAAAAATFWTGPAGVMIAQVAGSAASQYLKDYLKENGYSKAAFDALKGPLAQYIRETTPPQYRTTQREKENQAAEHLRDMEWAAQNAAAQRP